MAGELVLSSLPKTWLFDLDGTLLKHNGYLTDAGDSVLTDAKEYLAAIPKEDRIFILTSRTEEYKEQTLIFLKEQGIRYDDILFDMPLGERIIVNDRKPSGLDMAVAVNLDRDQFKMPSVKACR